MFLHDPVRKRDCLACHDAHASSESPIIRESGASLCYTCHVAQREAFKKDRVHEPVGEGACLECHRPHMSPFRTLTAEKPSELCAGCHETQTEAFISKHRGYNVAGSNCAGCHDPHASRKKGLAPAIVHEPYGENHCELCHR